MKHLFLVSVLSLFIFPTSIRAEIIESWVCQENPYGDWKNILVTATVDKGRTLGTIKVAGVEYRTVFKVMGFNRRWDFEASEGGFTYAFVIAPNGDAIYYDFSGADPGELVPPNMNLYCKQE